MKPDKAILTALALCVPSLCGAEVVAHFDMKGENGKISETVSGAKFTIDGNFAPETLAGATSGGSAIRFDGYTSRIKASLGKIIPDGAKTMTVSMWVAVPCYPIIQIDTDTSEKTPIVSCLDRNNKTGFGFFIGFNGKYSFETYIGGWPVAIQVDTPLPTYKWNNLTAVVDCDNRSVKLYNNGVEVGSSRATGVINLPASDFYMGQGTESRMAGPFELMSYNGLIGDITVWNEAIPETEIRSWNTSADPDLNIPASRFADDMQRPRFHGMPAAGWTNECHGMVFSDGRYHLFFQKNGDGPYMARLHWGHISSANLYDWREEKIAIAPGNPYDIKGCWSGCVFTDDVVTAGRPNILYTAVDYGHASIAQASPVTAALDNWNKNARNPIISGRPDGLSDDFRDPYFFRSGDNAYIIVGSSRFGVGTTTLHRYDPASGMWSNNGDLFFSGVSAGVDGSFWEMPNITPMPNGKWLFTTTPLGTSQGVRTLYWTGSISADGKFQPDQYSSRGRLVEMNSRDGFGLLSPTIYRHDGKTIALGIVPDKLPDVTNWKLGWAHCYSLPREWSLSPDGNLVQKPFSGLAGLRTSTLFSKSDFDLDGSQSLDPVSGREVEICAEFTVGGSGFGFKVFKAGNAEGRIYYNPASGEVIADFSRLPRLSNDNGVYDGIYRCPLRVRPKAGESLKLDVFIDHSIIDIFVNDTQATSIRVFPTDAQANGLEVYSESSVKVNDLKAWKLDVRGGAGVGAVSDGGDAAADSPVDVYTLQGVRIRSGVMPAEALTDLPEGVYIVGGKKIRI